MSCNDFTRSEVLRAAAGRGLPSIEPGMPLPAGTGLSRRQFVQAATGLGLAVFGGRAMAPGGLEEGIAAAQAAAAADGRVLVSVLFSGGLDSLSVLSPVTSDRYRALRPTLALSPSTDPLDEFTDDPSLHWAPAARSFRDLHRSGRLAVIPAIGYSSPNQSHFTSRHYWEIGELDHQGRTGWMGRFLDRVGTPDNPLQGVSLGGTLAPSLAPASVPVAALTRPERYALGIRDVTDAKLRAALPDALELLGSVPAPAGQGALAGARRAALQTAQLRDSLGPLQGTSAPWQQAVAYPSTTSTFPRRMAALAQMLALGLPLRCVAVDAHGGYDTHADQATSLPLNLALAADTLAAFQADLEARGLADRVLTLIWSEFGRRPQENGSGTDHGAGGLAMVMGTRAAGGMIEQFPGLTQLDARSNLRSTADFRGVYCSLLEQWFDHDAAAVIPGAGAFKRYQLVSAT